MYVLQIELVDRVLAEPVHISKCAQVSMFTCALGKMKALQLPPGGQSAATTVSPPLKGTIELSWPSSKAVTEIGRGSVQVQAVLLVAVSWEALAGCVPVMQRKST